jgi:HlyD family secretion protein
VQVKVQILNPDSYLRPDMNATVRFLANENKEARHSTGVLVPTSAVRDRDGKKIVFIAFKGKALLREVHVTSQRSAGYIVEGLVGGENVITVGPENLKDGQKINLKGQS